MTPFQHYKTALLREPVLFRGAILLAASLLLGLVYNQMHPLPVNATSGSPSPRPVSNIVPAHETSVAKSSDGVYQHEMMGIRLVGPSRNASPPSHAPITQVAWEEIRDAVRSGGIILVDARSRAVHEAGHIPASVSLPFQNVDNEIQRFMEQIDSGRTIVVYCADTNCPVSIHLALTLVRHGYRDVRYMPGGFLEWRKHQSSAARQIRPGE